VGALVGAAMVLTRLRWWPGRAVEWGRLFRVFGEFMGGGALWGSACGLAFGLVVWRLGRRSSLRDWSARRVTAWGAVAGAAFPIVLYTPLVLARGAFSAIPLFTAIAGLSALAGAGCARALVAVARRAPDPPEETASLPGTATAIGSRELRVAGDRELV